MRPHNIIRDVMSVRDVRTVCEVWHDHDGIYTAYIACPGRGVRFSSGFTTYAEAQAYLDEHCGDKPGRVEI